MKINDQWMHLCHTLQPMNFIAPTTFYNDMWKSHVLTFFNNSIGSLSLTTPTGKQMEKSNQIEKGWQLWNFSLLLWTTHPSCSHQRRHQRLQACKLCGIISYHQINFRLHDRHDSHFISIHKWMLERKKSAYPKYAADGIIWKWNSEMSKNISSECSQAPHGYSPRHIQYITYFRLAYNVWAKQTTSNFLGCDVWMSLENLIAVVVVALTIIMKNLFYHDEASIVLMSYNM